MSVKSFDDLVSIYQNSKISIHIPQIQVRRALPYRVFDIMASDSMLIFPMEEGSEVFKIFGDQPPFPLYRDADHLRQLCIQYLENEEARQAVVKACQDVMAAGFDFSDRVEFIESICGITESPASGRGVIKKISYVKSLKPTAYVSEVVRSTARAIIDSMLERMPLRLKFYVSLKLESIISQNWF
jgi:spore maturation protein CgeB